MKKVLIPLLCLVLVLSPLPLRAQAASPSLSLSCDSVHYAGETFTIDVTAASLNGCSSVAFHVTYNPDVVEVTGIQKADTLSTWQMVENLAYDEGDLMVTLASGEARNLSGTLVSISFTAKTTASGSAQFAITNPKAVDLYSNPISLSGGSTTISFEPMPSAHLTITPAAGEDGQVLFHVDLSQASPYCALTFVFHYDSNRYTNAEITRGEAFSTANGSKNNDYDTGAVFLSTLFANPTDLNGRVATIALTPKDGNADVTDVSLEITAFVNVCYESLPIDWSYNPFTLDSEVDSGNTLHANASLLNPSTQAQSYTMITALYNEAGKLLSTKLTTQTIPAGSCGTFSIAHPGIDDAAYYHVFFLDSNFCPTISSTPQVFSH